MKRFSRWFRSVAIGRRFASELAPHRGRFVAVAALSLLVAAFDLLKPWPIAWIVDGALVPVGEPRWAPGTTIAIGAGALFLIAVLRSLIQYKREIWLARSGTS